MAKAVYAGSFDPPTKGHLWVIEQGARLFDKLVVAAGINPEKKYAFSIDERREMLLEAIFQNISDTRCEVDSFEGMYQVKYAKSVDAQYLLRGVRSDGDYQYERGMRYVNSDMEPSVVTVFLIPPRDLVEVSSSFVKDMIGPEGWQEEVKRYVPESVYKKILEKFGGR